jgi:hypothetical protein
MLAVALGAIELDTIGECFHRLYTLDKDPLQVGMTVPSKHLKSYQKRDLLPYQHQQDFQGFCLKGKLM